MAISNTVSSNLLSAFIDCLDCFLLLPIRCDKVIEIVTSFLHKILVTMYLQGMCTSTTPPPFFWGGVGLRLVAACRNSNRDMYEGHPINRENFLTIQEIVPVKHRKCNL